MKTKKVVKPTKSTGPVPHKRVQTAEGKRRSLLKETKYKVKAA